VLTYVDAGVLIAAARGRSLEASRALAVLDDAAREFAASDFLRLEVLPKAIYNQRASGSGLYDRYFRGVRHWAVLCQALLDSARAVAAQHGLAAMDALHVAAAEALGVAEFVNRREERETAVSRHQRADLVASWMSADDRQGMQAAGAVDPRRWTKIPRNAIPDHHCGLGGERFLEPLHARA
jgi:predicted nucleic acid-binding protein